MYRSLTASNLPIAITSSQISKQANYLLLCERCVGPVLTVTRVTWTRLAERGPRKRMPACEFDDSSIFPFAGTQPELTTAYRLVTNKYIKLRLSMRR